MKALALDPTGLTIDTPEFAGPLEDLAKAVHTGSIPVERLRLALICRQLLEKLDVRDADRAGEAAVLAAGLVELRTRCLLADAQRLRAWARADRFLELAGGGGILFVDVGDGEESEDRAAFLRFVRLERERALLQALVERVDAQETERFGHRGGLSPDGEAVLEGGEGDDVVEEGVPVDELVGRLRAAARTLPDVEWHTVPGLMDEIREHVYGEGACDFASFCQGERRRAITAFLALLELVRTPTLELPDAGGVLFVGVKVQQLARGQLLVAPPWMDLPRPPRRSSQRRRPDAAVRSIPRATPAPPDLDALEAAFDKVEELFAHLENLVGLPLAKAQSRADLAVALGAPS